MKIHFFSIVITFLKDFGIDVVVFVAGVGGGITMLTKSTKLTKLQKFTTVVSGGLTANYLTPVVAEWLSLSDKALYGIAFLLGYGGLKSVETIYLAMHEQIAKQKNT